MMRTLNDIPEELREPVDADWTPARGLRKAVLWTTPTCLFLAAAVGGVTYFVPALTLHWLLAFVLGFAVSAVLFFVVHTAAGMVGASCTLLAILASAVVFFAKYAAFTVLIAHQGGVPWSFADVFNPFGFLLLNFSSWIGLCIAVAMCKDGDGIVGDLAAFLMVNPFTGRRV